MREERPQSQRGSKARQSNGAGERTSSATFPMWKSQWMTNWGCPVQTSKLHSGRNDHTSSSPVIQNHIRYTKLILARCLKITEKVSFNILTGQKLVKKAKNGSFWRVLETWSLRSNSVTRQVSFYRTKIGGKCQFKCDILSIFQTMF